MFLGKPLPIWGTGIGKCKSNPWRVGTMHSGQGRYPNMLLVEMAHLSCG
jgi:hypothetical protein